MFRNPLYLNTPLLRSLADYQGIVLQGDREVKRRTRGSSRGRVGLNKIIEAGREDSSEDEFTETYQEQFRPVRALNNVIDALLDGDEIIDLTLDDTLPVSRRSVIQAEGEWRLSALTEVAALMAALLPSLVDQAASGKESFEPDPSILASMFVGASQPNVTHVYDLEVGEHAFVVMVDPEHLLHATPEDLEDELTVLATVDRLVADGQSKSMDRYLLPDVSRSVRRMLTGGELEELLRSFGDAFNRKIGPGDLVVGGPAAVLTPIAVY